MTGLIKKSTRYVSEIYLIYEFFCCILKILGRIWNPHVANLQVLNPPRFFVHCKHFISPTLFLRPEIEVSQVCVLWSCILLRQGSCNLIKKDSAQHSSNKCKKYLLIKKTTHPHGTVIFSMLLETPHSKSLLQVTPQWNSQAFSRKLMSTLVKIC